jgi:uncharacterized NAD-dependent epimerase/dehydratase family protein
MDVAKPYLLFLGDVPDQLAAKTAHGVVDWRPEWCLASTGCRAARPIATYPDMTSRKAVEAGARTMVVGVVNAGGVLPEHWVGGDRGGARCRSRRGDRTAQAPRLGAGHRRGRGPQWPQAARPALFRRAFETGKGTKRPGRRLITVGTDCSVGKKYTALALERKCRSAASMPSFGPAARPVC